MSSELSNRKRFFIIDGYAVLYRSHYALIRNPLVTSYGLHSSALFGFINQVMKLIRSEDPDYIACAFDSKEKTFRHDMYKEYKANRSPMPEEMQMQLPHLWELLEAMKMPVIKKPGFEADDIIGTLAIQADAVGLDTYIVSGDKDFMQLINDHIYLYAPGTKKIREPIIYDRKKVEEKWGVPPEKIIDLLGLMGDSSDNVPGVSGVGAKTAVKLIKEYGSLEGALENSNKVTNKRVYNGLVEDVENAKLSKELVTICKDVELTSKVTDFKISPVNVEACKQKFTELEFHALIKQLEPLSDNKEKLESPKTIKDYRTVLTEKNLDKMIKELENSERFSFNVQITGLIPMGAEIVGLSFSKMEHSGWYLPVEYKEKEKNNFGDDDLTFILEKLRPLFTNPLIEKVGQNIKFDALILKSHGIDISHFEFDTMVAAHLINPASRSYKLETLSLEYLNYEMVSIEELIGKGKNQITMDEVPLEQAVFYAVEGSDVAFQLTNIFKNRLKEEGLFTYFQDIEMKLISVLLDMEFEGAFVDSELLENMSIDLEKKVDQLKDSIYRISGTEFNINSTQQLANILFDILELPQIKKRSTAEPVLKQLQEIHELPKNILEYRKYNKLKSTYVDALPELINLKTKRIHSTFNQTIAATGRLSSSNPNFQNIPIRKDEGREIRKAFRAQNEGWKILSADYSQVELRIMAHFSNDNGLIEAFKKGEDIHSRTASSVFNVPLNMVLPEMRRTAKVVNFGIMYGAGPFRMSQELGISRKEAIKIIDSYFEQYSGIKRYIKTTLEKARSDKYVETILGRRRPVWDADSDNGLRRQAAERMAINMPIQGSAAELIKIAMISINEEISSRNMEAKMTLQIHDELLFEFPNKEEDDLVKLVIEKMEKAMQLSVPLIVDHGIGETWYDAH